MITLCAPCANAPIVPVTVCEVLHDLSAAGRAPVAVMGRYSFRSDGRWLSEQACDGAAPPVLWLVEDGSAGPKPPADFELDGVVLGRKFSQMQMHTALGKFRFGSSDYDRWAVVYGQVQPRAGEAAKKAPADLVFRGDGVVVFLTP